MSDRPLTDSKESPVFGFGSINKSTTLPSPIKTPPDQTSLSSSPPLLYPPPMALSRLAFPSLFSTPSPSYSPPPLPLRTLSFRLLSSSCTISMRPTTTSTSILGKSAASSASSATPTPPASAPSPSTPSNTAARKAPASPPPPPTAPFAPSPASASSPTSSPTLPPRLPPRLLRHRPRPLLHRRRRLLPPQRPALRRRLPLRHRRRRPQRQPRQLPLPPHGSRGDGVHLQHLLRHRGRPPPDRRLQVPPLRVPPRRGLSRLGRRVFDGLPHQGQARRGPRPLRLPPPRRGPDPRIGRDRLRVRDVRARPHRRGLRRGGRAGRGHRRRRQRHEPVLSRPPPVNAARVRVRARVLRAPPLARLRHARSRVAPPLWGGPRRGGARGLRCGHTRSRLGVLRGAGVRGEARGGVPAGAHSIALCRAHVHTAHAGGAGPWGEAEACAGEAVVGGEEGGGGG
ncbi:hypothetical protein QJS10_CPA01g02967 [Acorus calamus]|uniref:Uncharacterized protein n=1 Tax=Acorus calamus TaxID=4465 RepID=A0AAV9FI61_ACOCL|nr:hypothetical protein QJS10_CPA01g02967 [Acorus calamus]